MEGIPGDPDPPGVLRGLWCLSIYSVNRTCRDLVIQILSAHAADAVWRLRRSGASVYLCYACLSLLCFLSSLSAVPVCCALFFVLRCCLCVSVSVSLPELAKSLSVSLSVCLDVCLGCGPGGRTKHRPKRCIHYLSAHVCLSICLWRDRGRQTERGQKSVLAVLLYLSVCVSGAWGRTERRQIVWSLSV